MRTRLWIVWLGLAAASSLSAQVDPAPMPKSRPGTDRVFRGNCSEAQSRDLFTATDTDGDDRLDVFEAHDALDAMRDLRDHDGFARLDADRDGYVSWPEFDRSLRTSLQQGGSFRVRTQRRLLPSAPEAKAATPLQKFLQLHDSNGNGGLDPAEIDKFLRESELSPALGGQLRTLDHDRSGRLEEAELAPWFEQLPGRGPEPVPAKASPLPTPWSTADTDCDGALDQVEWQQLLRRLDPTLERNAEDLRRRLDRTKDGKLQADELPPKPPLRPGTSVALRADSPRTLASQLPAPRPVR
jgi:Ca2+-binding EF-hand superfamily protein